MIGSASRRGRTAPAHAPFTNDSASPTARASRHDANPRGGASPKGGPKGGPKDGPSRNRPRRERRRRRGGRHRDASSADTSRTSLGDNRVRNRHGLQRSSRFRRAFQEREVRQLRISVASSSSIEDVEERDGSSRVAALQNFNATCREAAKPSQNSARATMVREPRLGRPVLRPKPCGTDARPEGIPTRKARGYRGPFVVRGEEISRPTSCPRPPAARSGRARPWAVPGSPGCAERPRGPAPLPPERGRAGSRRWPSASPARVGRP